MTDDKIIALYFERNEDAIQETKNKYSRYLLSVAQSIVSNQEDAEECENSTYFATWNSIPPNRPHSLSGYLSKITRNFALKKLRTQKTEKRGGGEALLSLGELNECIPASAAFDENLTRENLGEILSAFLKELPDTEQRLFICRYFRCDSIATLAQNFGMKESRVKVMLMRTREKLAKHLTEKGVFL
ncbi:MAG: sigma-70 family RNA polymerase sigma factor [Clostridia bacterium]|nr:sigma-70 family RNA polymerase sigma factor [Clostridia bacterium]